MKFDEFEITAADDFHCHLREGDKLLAFTLAAGAQNFRRILAMPNLKSPIIDLPRLDEYRQDVARAQSFVASTPDAPPPADIIFTLYLHDQLDPSLIETAYKAGKMGAIKLYPAHATTNSAAGVTDILALGAIYETMSALNIPLLIHGEVTDPAIDIFDREAAFITQILAPLQKAHPRLKMVLEHITTKQAVDYVRAGNHEYLAATITPHHMLSNRNDLFKGGMRPHNYCLPVLKREGHRKAVAEAAISGLPCFFAGTDSAPHLEGAKLSACGCAGIFHGDQPLAFYVEAFDDLNALDRLEGFTSHFGADFYGIARNQARQKITRKPRPIPSHYQFDKADPAAKIIPYRAGEAQRFTISYC